MLRPSRVDPTTSAHGCAGISDEFGFQRVRFTYSSALSHPLRLRSAMARSIRRSSVLGRSQQSSSSARKKHPQPRQPAKLAAEYVRFTRGLGAPSASPTPPASSFGHVRAHRLARPRPVYRIDLTFYGRPRDHLFEPQGLRQWSGHGVTRAGGLYEPWARRARSSLDFIVRIPVRGVRSAG